jgi:hypothetical protein
MYIARLPYRTRHLGCGKILFICQRTLSLRSLQVLALGALFEHPQYVDEPVRGLEVAPRVYPKSPVKDRSHQQALMWYNRSLSKLRVNIENGKANRVVVLISCILYIGIELLQDNIKEVLQLYYHGIGIISNCTGSMLEKFVTSFFHNFGALAMAMDYISPNMIPDSEAPDTNLDEVEHDLYRFLPQLVSYRQASGKAFLIEEHLEKHRLAELKAQEQFVSAELGQWLQKFHALGVTLESYSSPAERFTAATLLQTHAVLRGGVATSMSFSEMANDDIVDIYDEILHYGRYIIAATRYPDGTQPPFSLEGSNILPLYVCATKCRDYRVRHAALDLLWQAPKVQGLCKSTHYALMASQIISIEEAGLEFVYREDGKGPSMFIPESRRIINAVITSVKNKNGEDEWALRHMRRVPDADGYRIVEELSPFDFSGKSPVSISSPA